MANSSPIRKRAATLLERLLDWWHDYQWPVIGALWFIALMLGYIGLSRYYSTPGLSGFDKTTTASDKRSPLDILYLTLQLFALNSYDYGRTGWELQVARFLAPSTALYTVVRAFALLFYDQIQLFRLRFIADHVVVCGLGRKGLLLARALRAQGRTVVVIEQNEGNDLVPQCRDAGAIMLIGDAAVRDWLSKASVQTARHLIAVCGDDGTNSEIAVHARDLMMKRKGAVLTCITHIVDPVLCHLLRERELDGGRNTSFRLQFFSVYDYGARALLTEHPPFDGAATEVERAPHLLLVGAGRLGQSCAVQAARTWSDAPAAAGTRLRISLVDPAAPSIRDTLRLHYPHLGTACDLEAFAIEWDAPEFHRAEFLFDEHGERDVSAIYVCLENDAAGLAAALALLQRARTQDIPIVVCMNRNAGLATLLQRADQDGDGAFGNLSAFGLLDETCRPDLLLGGTHEILARAAHEEYRRQQEKAGQKVHDNPALVPWTDLAEEYKESSRRQADSIGVKLQAIGCGIAPLTAWNAAPVEFGETEVELMARMEHERWMADKQSQGWKFGPNDRAKKTNPNLLAWDKLPEAMREFNRDTIRELPAFLARAGFQIYRRRVG